MEATKHSVNGVEASVQPAAACPKFDVVEIELRPHCGAVRRIMARDLSEANAEAYVNIAVMRRGVEDSIYKAVPTGSVECEERHVIRGAAAPSVERDASNPKV